MRQMIISPVLYLPNQSLRCGDYYTTTTQIQRVREVWFQKFIKLLTVRIAREIANDFIMGFNPVHNLRCKPYLELDVYVNTILRCFQQTETYLEEPVVVAGARVHE
jgi:hypothetical protein